MSEQGSGKFELLDEIDGLNQKKEEGLTAGSVLLCVVAGLLVLKKCRERDSL